MISELKDDEILDFLMTSDFEGDYKPEELKYLLNKWRYFYRLLYSRTKTSHDDISFELGKLKESIESLNNELVKLQTENANKQNIIDSNKNRKLSLKERITGKIITKKDEN
jgi:hypothetical protein